ncbi:MAG: hypothetical protein AAGF23_05655 [Acidobacteriota bacterium]
MLTRRPVFQKPFQISMMLTAGLFAVPADAERNCQRELTQCNTRCNQEMVELDQKAEARDEALGRETQRYERDVHNCRERWGQARDYWATEYDESLANCTDAACRQRALGTYNINVNMSALGETACVERAYDVYRDRVDEITDRYSHVPTGPNPGYAWNQRCKEECTTQSRECQDDMGDGVGEGDEAGMRLEPCPPGTQPSPLGVCTVRFASQPNSSSFLEPGTCPEGSVPGPDDRCVPKTRMAGVVQSFGEWWLLCPEGTEPSPVDGGCVPRLEGDEVADPELGPECTPGFEPGPVGGCVPIPPTLPTEEGGGFWNAMRVDDPQFALEVTEGLLGARRVGPEVPEL